MKKKELEDCRGLLWKNVVVMHEAAELILSLEARIDELEAALRKVIENNDSGSYESTGQAIDEARAVLDRK